MKILFTSPILEHPAAGGPQLRIENSIKALASICDLYILNRTLIENSQLKKTEDFFKSLSVEYHTFYLHRNKGKNSLLYKFKKIMERITSTYRTYTILEQIVEENNINLIWFGYGNISYPLINLVRKRMPTAILICDTDSVWSRFILREIPYAKGFRKLSIFIRGNFKKMQEKMFVKICDVVTAVSDIDATYYKSLTKNKEKIKVFSNVIDLENYQMKVKPPKNLKKPSLYLAGTFGHHYSPMDMAARWLIKDIMPLVWKENPNVHLYILGRNSEVQFSKTLEPRISVVGEVESTLPYLQNIDIALVPLKYESGTRFKILEAAACKIPIITTTLGAEGLLVKDRVHVLVADSSGSFAARIIELLHNRDTLDALGTNCYKLIRENYSLDRARSEASEILIYTTKK